MWEVESNDESESPRGCFRSVHISLALLSILCFGVFPQIRLGPEKDWGSGQKQLTCFSLYLSLPVHAVTPGAWLGRSGNVGKEKVYAHYSQAALGSEIV